MTNRKYENGMEIMNEKGLRLCGVIDYNKLVIERKAKQRKTDSCVKYICNIFDNDGKFRGCFILKETTIDSIIENQKEKI